MNVALKIIVVLAVAFIVLNIILAKMAKQPTNLGVQNGQLTPCPGSPNCVTTQSNHPSSKMEAIAYEGTLADNMTKLKNVIEQFSKTNIISEKENYLHVTFGTPIFNYIDDVEFYFDDANKLLHFRSASRIGYSDMGVNKKRMQKVTARFAQQ